MINPGDGIWDEGEWVSWSSINAHLADQELQEQFPHAELELIRVFQQVLDAARSYKEITGRYLPVFGELGELYAELQFGIKRHKPRSQGSDGRLGNDFVEIKTITPEKQTEEVVVKRSGHFNKLVVVKINAEFEFEARLLERKQLRKGTGTHAKVAWSTMPPGTSAA